MTSAEYSMSTSPNPQSDNQASLTGSGALAQGPGAKAVGERAVNVEGNVGGSINTGDTFITQIVQGLGDIATDYLFAVQDFLHYYLGAQDQPAPFGGRDAELQHLDDWLADPHAPRYALVTAPAGRGKSALLAQWIYRVQARDLA